jgi:hypothetical protein
VKGIGIRYAIDMRAQRFISLKNYMVKLKVKLSRYRPGQALGVAVG